VCGFVIAFIGEMTFLYTENGQEGFSSTSLNHVIVTHAATLLFQ
jgi:hypothetical protein